MHKTKRELEGWKENSHGAGMERLIKSNLSDIPNGYNSSVICLLY